MLKFNNIHNNRINQILIILMLSLVWYINCQTCYGTSNSYIGFRSNSNLGNTRCTSVGSSYCCKCPYGKMVPPSISGTYFAISGTYFEMSGESDCIECEIGSYSDTSTQGICSPCSAGKYQDKIGQSSCIFCPTGQTTMSFLMASNWPGGILETNHKYIYYGAYSESQCTSPPEGYILNQERVDQSDSKLFQYLNVDFNIDQYNACEDIYKVTTTGISTGCSYCSSNKVFYAGGKFFNRYDSSYNSIGGYIYSGQFYGDNYYFQTATPTLSKTGTTDFMYLYPYEYHIESAKCLDVCPVGYEATATELFGTDTKKCSKCRGGKGEYGSAEGVCTLCPETSYPASDGALSCTKCAWPYLSMLMEDDDDSSSFLVCTIFCLCLKQSSVIMICLLISLFFSLNLFVFFYFGNFTHKPRQKLNYRGTSIEATKRYSTVNDDKKTASDALEVENIDVEEVDNEKAGDGANEVKKKESVLTRRNVLVGLVAYIFVPFVDNITDLAFLLSNKFANFLTFVLFVSFFCLPGVYFFKTLIEMKAVPKFYILPMPKYLLFDEYNSLYKVIVGSITLIPFIAINSPTLVPLLLSGNLLYGTKAFAVRPVAILWLHIWTGSRFSKPGSDEDKHRQNDILYANEYPIDEKVLNEALFSHFLGETVPLLVLQITNNIVLRSWTSLGYFSVAFSVFNAASGLYRIGYYRLVCKIPIEKIPINFEIFGFKVFGDKYVTALTGTDSKVKHTTTFWKKDGYSLYELSKISTQKDNKHHDKKSGDNDDENDDTRSLLLEMKKEMNASNKKHDTEIKFLKERLEKVEHTLEMNTTNDYYEYND